MKHSHWLASLLALGACSSPAADIPVRVVWASQYCQQPEGLSQIKTAEALAELTQAAGPMVGDGVRPAPSFPEGEHLLLLSLGQKNSGGHGVDLSRTPVRPVDDVLKIPVEIHAPAEGSLQTMQITSPCALIAAAKGRYEQVEIASWRAQVQSD